MTSSDLASISSFSPDKPYVEPSLSLASSTGSLSDNFKHLSFLTLRWEFPDSSERVYKCEATGMNIHGHAVTIHSQMTVRPGGQLSAQHMLKELQKLGAKNTEVDNRNKVLKMEVAALRQQVFHTPPYCNGSSCYFMSKVRVILSVL